jgi:hypothetical protein
MKEQNKTRESKRINKIRKDKQQKFNIKLLKKQQEHKIKATIQMRIDYYD